MMLVETIVETIRAFGEGVRRSARNGRILISDRGAYGLFVLRSLNNRQQKTDRLTW